MKNSPQSRFTRNIPAFSTLLILAALILALALTGCSKADSGGVKTIIVGTSNDYPPLCYLDADGNLAGFERDALEAIDDLLPQYKFKYEVLEFKNILASLEAGRLDIAAHNFSINEERQQKYLFSNEGYLTGYSYIVVPGATQGVSTLEDLKGKTISVPPATNWAYTVEDFNRQHPDNPILINYFEQTPDVLIANLLTGVVDATMLSESDVKLANTFWGTDFKTVGDPIGEAEEARYVFQKNNPELRDAVDGALKQLKESGRLAEITKQAVDDFYVNAKR
ncbi:L-cystine-binding protein TcyK [Spirochaetia bacterium]|nr:L-cystine-binding protein TcyK [Spirochaetia bacterium]